MRGLTILVFVLLVAACRGEERSDTPSDTLTQRQRDSAIGESGLPGAGGVRKALDAADTAAARNRRLDSLGR